MKRLRYGRMLLVSGLLLALAAGMALAHRDPGLPDNDLVQKIDAIIHSDPLKRAFSGVLIESMKDGRVLYSHEPTRIYIPASCMKLIVGSAMLDAKGPDYRFKTEVRATGEQKGDTLSGDLILKGYGDATLETKGMAEIADAIKALGIRKVTGDLVADDTYFDDQRLGTGWNWDYEPDDYAAQISALIVNRNCTTVEVKAAKVGEPVQVSFNPPTDYLTIENHVKTALAKTKTSIWPSRRLYTNVITVNGSFAADTKPDYTRLTVHEPSLYVGDVFRIMLKERGISFGGKLRTGAAPADSKVLNTHLSEPLSSVLEILNRHSDNTIAECMLKSLGAEVKGHGTYWSGIQAEEDFLRKAGVELDQVNICDGSGLSRMDMVSPTALVKILRYDYNGPNSAVYWDTLPVAGGDGTLYYSMKGTLAEGNLRAKTGNVGWVQSISGFVKTKGGELLVFSMIWNNFKSGDNEIYKIRTKIGAMLADLP